MEIHSCRRSRLTLGGLAVCLPLRRRAHCPPVVSFMRVAIFQQIGEAIPELLTTCLDLRRLQLSDGVDRPFAVRE